MKIIAAYHKDSRKNLTPEQIQADMPALEKEHKKALAAEATWQFFGGIIVIGEHEYQVC
jgi:hypothetical protein